MPWNLTLSIWSWRQCMLLSRTSSCYLFRQEHPHLQSLSTLYLLLHSHCGTQHLYYHMYYFASSVFSRGVCNQLWKPTDMQQNAQISEHMINWTQHPYPELPYAFESPLNGFHILRDCLCFCFINGSLGCLWQLSSKEGNFSSRTKDPEEVGFHLEYWRNKLVSYSYCSTCHLLFFAFM